MGTMNISELKGKIESELNQCTLEGEYHVWKKIKKWVEELNLEQPAGGVPKELRERLNSYTDMNRRSSLPNVGAIADINELLAIADAQSGWVEGPPTGAGSYQVESKQGRQYAVDVLEDEVGGYASDTTIAWHFHIPERIPPKLEPVVDCCSFGRDNIKLVNGQWDMTITVEHPGGNLKTYSLTPTRCICDTELPKRNHGE